MRCLALAPHLFSLRFNKENSNQLEVWSQSVTGKRKPLENPASIEFYAGRAALKLLLDKIGVHAFIEPDLEFGFLKLVCRNKKLKLFANISHTKGMAVAAIYHNPIGIDVEHISRSAERVVSRIASRDELMKLRKYLFKIKKSLVSPELTLWCAKEAYLKALGIGMRRDPKLFELTWSFGRLSAKTSVHTPFQLTKPQFKFHVHENYLFSICSDGELERLVAIHQTI